ncbi:MAG: 4Fe-4S dicluster domain-containing protein [Halanaerobiaceae bacterium]
MADISVSVLGMKMKNPVMPAAGPPVKDGAAAVAAKNGGAGAIVTKTISVKAAQVPRPNMAQVKGGFMNTELWSELSPERWLKEEYPRVKETGLPVIAGLGYTSEEIRELASQIEPFANALELSTHYLGDDPSPVVESVKAAKEVVEIPVLVKLSPQVDIPRFARAAEEAGADGIVLINSFGPTLDIDVETGRPLMGSEDGSGWLSGDAIFPLALRSVFDAVKSVDIPVFGVGGISSGLDAVKMIMVGAQAVQVCTAAIVNGSSIYGKIAEEINEFLDEHGYDSLADIRGLAQDKIPEEANYRTKVPTVIDDNCTGCGLCITSCVYDAINFTDFRESVVIDEEKCEGCGLCVTRCNFGALKLNR